MNLYLPSVKLVKKVRVGSKVRRIYDAAQTPLERVLACAQAKPEQVAELKKLRQSLDPFQLGEVDSATHFTTWRIGGSVRKLGRISRGARRNKSGNEREAGGTAVEKPLRGKVPNPTFSPSLPIAQKARAWHFPTAATTAGLQVTFPMSRRSAPGLHS